MGLLLLNDFRDKVATHVFKENRTKKHTRELEFYDKHEELCKDLDLSTEHFDKVLHRAKSRLKQALALKCNIALDKQSLFTLLSVAAVIGWLGTRI